MSDLIPIKLAELAIAAKNNEIAKLKADLTNCQSEADRLKADLHRVTRLYQILLDKSDKRLDQIEDLQAEVEKWKSAESVACDKLLEVCNEVKRLNSELFTCSCANAKMNMHMNENARLKAEVERLTKAGDAMHSWLYEIAKGWGGEGVKVMRDWKAAKEGKDL